MKPIYAPNSIWTTPRDNSIQTAIERRRVRHNMAMQHWLAREREVVGAVISRMMNDSVQPEPQRKEYVQ